MKFIDAIRTKPLLFDGAISTVLSQRGLIQKGQRAEQLTLTHPADVMDIHTAYLDAGADVLTTNTFGANLPQFYTLTATSKWEELVYTAVLLARESVQLCEREAFVALSVGSTGEYFSPVPRLNPEQLYELYYREISIGASAGADLIFIEAIDTLEEARIALLACQDACALPAALSYRFVDEGRTLSGATPESAGLCAYKLGADLVGVNCGLGPLEDFDSFRRIQAASGLPSLAVPNAGSPVESNAKGEPCYPYSPEKMCETMLPYLQANACAIGGGRGTTPDHIAQLRALVDSQPAPQEKIDFPDCRICSPGCVLSFEQAILQKPITLPMNLDEACSLVQTRAVPGKAMHWNLKQRSPEYICSLLDKTLPVLNRTPLVFTLNRAEQAEAALRRYPGIAAVFCEGDMYQVAKLVARYGAELAE